MNRCCRALVQPEALFFLAVWALFLVLFQERGFYDPGALWHTVVGERILTDGFMTTDPFTYTHEGRTWIPQQWGAEVLMALAHRAGGLDTMLLGFVTLVAGVFTWVFLRMRQAGMHWALAGVLTGAVLFTASFHFYVRPHMATIALLGWTMGCLVDFDRGRVSSARLAGLIPLFILWTNLHAGVLGGVMTFGLALAGWGLLFLAKRDGPIRSWRSAWLIAGILASCALTPFDNPFGMEMIHTWQRIVGSTVLKDVVSEHKPLDLTQRLDQVIAACGLFYVVLLAGVLPKSRREFRITWLIPLVWLALTFKGIRQGPLFAITAGVVIADFWPHTIWQTLLKKYGDSLAYGSDDVQLRPVTFTLPIIAVLTALGLQVGGVAVPVIGHGWARLDTRLTPTDLTETIETEMTRTGPHARILNDCNLGGYWIYHHPKWKSFMDDRFELFGDAWTSAYVDMLWDHPERIEEYADLYGCTHALVATDPEQPPLDAYLSKSPRWQEVARSIRTVFYRRVSP